MELRETFDGTAQCSAGSTVVVETTDLCTGHCFGVVERGSWMGGGVKGRMDGRFVTGGWVRMTD